MVVLRFVCIGLISFLLGCVSKPMEDRVHAPSLMISQNSDGLSLICWKSDLNHRYTLYYQDLTVGKWKILRGGNGVSGTGQTLTVTDHVNPNNPPRRYRLEIE